jgi:hypothetical protein
LSLISSELGAGSCFELSLNVCEEEPPVYVSTTLKKLKEKSIMLVDITASNSSSTLDNLVITKMLDKYKMKFEKKGTLKCILSVSGLKE